MKIELRLCVILSLNMEYIKRPALKAINQVESSLFELWVESESSQVDSGLIEFMIDSFVTELSWVISIEL